MTDISPKLYSTGEAAEILGVARKTVQRWIKKGQITYTKINKRYYLSAADIDLMRDRVPATSKKRTYQTKPEKLLEEYQGLTGKQWEVSEGQQKQPVSFHTQPEVVRGPEQELVTESTTEQSARSERDETRAQYQHWIAYAKCADHARAYRQELDRLEEEWARVDREWDEFINRGKKR